MEKIRQRFVALYIATIASIATMVTSIQLSEETKRELFRIVTELQAKLGRRVDYDEAIMTLISQIRGVEEPRKEFQSMFGALAGAKSAWKDLKGLRAEEEKRLARLAKSGR